MKYKNLSKTLETLSKKDLSVRRYSLAEIISESYKSLYDCKKGSNLQSLVESHLEDVRQNPTDTERLSRQLCQIKYLSMMVESKEMDDSELLVPEEKHSKVVPDEQEIKESAHDEDVSEEDDENLLDESSHDEDVEETDDEDLLEDAELSDEEVAELTKHLAEIRKNKKVAESTKQEDEEEVVEATKPRKLVRRNDIKRVMTSSQKTYEGIDLSEFNKKSSSKAFVKTFKKLDAKLHEGTALTRQESIALYKAANSAMTHLSVELEHNPGFLATFKESVSILSEDVRKILGSLMENKAPSKATMKSLAKFSEALLREEEEEELPPIEDEEDTFVDEEPAEDEVSEESEEFDQEYADARVELHKELADEHADTENPEVQEKLEQDAEEVVNLPGITDEQVAEITGEDSEVADESEEDTEETDESVHDEDVEEVEEKKEETTEEEEPEDLDLDDTDITDDELAELKKHLTEMRKARKSK